MNVKLFEETDEKKCSILIFTDTSSTSLITFFSLQENKCSMSTFFYIGDFFTILYNEINLVKNGFSVQLKIRRFSNLNLTQIKLKKPTFQHFP